MIAGYNLQESNFAARPPRRAPHHVIQATTSEELAQGPYVSDSEFEPGTFPTEDTEHHQVLRREWSSGLEEAL